jgi:two-component system, response regulator PdtaR
MGRILIVEDEFLIAIAAEEALLAAGFEVVGIADSYEAALGMADALRPDLALMDIRLKSDKDGIDTATELRQRHDIPSIFTSGNQDPANVTRAAPCRPAAWLPKPYSDEQIVQAVRDVLDDI